MPSVRHLAPIAALALVAGGAVAQASGGGATTPAPVVVVPSRAPAAVTLVDAGPPAVRIVARRSGRPAAPISVAAGTITTAAPAGVPVFTSPVRACKPSKASAAPAAPSDALKDAFGILRRDRNDDDTLPAAALTALERSGLKPVDPQSARLLRADGAARAWVVPVPDVDAASRFGCSAGKATVAREGLAVVSVGGAAAGGGGALRDLVRGIAPASIDPCAGAASNMTGVSGIVPDDVEAVFVTAADGTATRADVHDNGFTFVLPRVRRLESRYLVWTASDGTPHVQPLAVLPFGQSKKACARVSSIARVTPSITDFACGPFGAAPVIRQPFPLVVPKRPASKRSSSAGRRAAARRAAARRAAARRAVARRKTGRAKPARRLLPPPIRYAPLPVCAPSAFVQIAPGSGRILPQAAPPRVKAPTVTVPQRVPAPTATVPAAPRAGAPVVTVPPRAAAPTATVPAAPKPRTTP